MKIVGWLVGYPMAYFRGEKIKDTELSFFLPLPTSHPCILNKGYKNVQFKFKLYYKNTIRRSSGHF